MIKEYVWKSPIGTEWSLYDDDGDRWANVHWATVYMLGVVVRGHGVIALSEAAALIAWVTDGTLPDGAVEV